MRKILLSKVAFLLLFAISATFSVSGQVTTSAISGIVSDDKGDGLPGATVVAIHEPTGTKYGTTTRTDGNYNMVNLRVGGPYKVTVSFVGFKPKSEEGIYTTLGSNNVVNFKMLEEGSTLNEVVVTAAASDIFGSGKTGTSTTINKQALQTLPTIGSRSINDFTKYNPQGNGRSFGGQDSRLNNFSVDGSVFNNGFGLGSSAQAGGRTNSTAISLDAIEELTVNVAPFDVRQSGFVGAGLNAITRSGTNNLTGSVFHSFRNESKTFNGDAARDIPVKIGKYNESIYGFRLGGAIIKNKLFFFINGETQKRVEPVAVGGINFVAKESTNPGTPTRVLTADLNTVSSLLKSKFGYETGAFENYDDETKSDKFMARLDYNLNDANKVTLRYTFHESQDYVPISNSSSAGFGNRITTNSMSYKNSGYLIQDNTSSIVAEINSTLKGRISNNFIIGYDKQNEDRAYAGAVFPTIDILNGGSTYISAGMDPFTPDNKLNYSTFHITNNLTMFAGKHTITLGGNYEKYISNNLFFPASNGVWVYNSLDDFTKSVNGDASITLNRFQYRYSALSGGIAPLQVLKVNKLDFYAQDDVQLNSKFKFSYGVRAGIVSFANTALENPVISAAPFRDENDQIYKVNTGVLPATKILWEPRIGFNYDVKGDQTTQLRGGAGIFTGRPPYVFVSNQIGNNGILTGFIDQANTKAYPFTANPTVYQPATPTLPSTFDIASTDPDYRFPQVAKINLALDQKIANTGLVASVDVLYNKFLNSVFYFDANLELATANFTGPDTRQRFPGSGLTGANLNSAIRINDNVSRAAVMKSVNQGSNYSITGKLEKPWSKGFYGMVAYTYSNTKDLMQAGSIASGSWTSASSIEGNNNLSLAYSDNDLPHRVVGALSYRLDYGKTFGGSTTFSLGYVGGTGTSRYSYTIGGDMNGDGVAGNELFFVPNAATDFTWSATTTIGGVAYTAAQQAAALDAYINQDDYLSKMRGRYTQRNGALLPWLNQFDLSIIQEFHVKAFGKRNTFQIRADIANVGNLINSNWGIGQVSNNFSSTGNRVSPITFVSVSAAGVPTYRINSQTVKRVNADGINTTSTTEVLKDTFQYRSGQTDVWNGQLMLRYIFN
jgi:Carboxypeptidase regulatory-like domain